MRAEKRKTPTKTFQSRVENQHTPRTDDVETGIEPRLHWWHAIALREIQSNSLPNFIIIRMAYLNGRSW